MRAFREACEIVVKMWTEEKATFKGRYHSVDGAINEPKGVQKPHIPLWLGGGGEKVTLKLVAQWGSASNFGGGDLDVVRHKIGELRQHCGALDRDFDTIVRSTNMNLFVLEPGENPEKTTANVRGDIAYEDFAKHFMVATADEIAEHIEKLADEGINYVITYFPGVAYDHTSLHRFAKDVMPRFKR